MSLASNTLSLRFAFGLLLIALAPAVVTANDLIDFLKKWGGNQQNYDARQQTWEQQQNQRYQRRPIPPQNAVPQNPVGIPFRLPAELTLRQDQCGLEPGLYDFDLYGNERMSLRVEGGGGRLIAGGANPQALLAEAQVLQPHVQQVVRAVRSVNDRDLRDAASDAERELERAIRELQRGDVAEAREHHDHFSADWQRFAVALSRYRVGPAIQQHLTSIENHEHRLDALFRDRGRFWDYDRPRLYGLARVLEEKAAALEAAYVANVGDWRSRALARQIRRVHFCAEGFVEAVSDNADFETLVEEYRIFDDAWHHVLDRTGRLGEYRPQLISIGRDIWDIDAALAEVLLVNPPSLPNPTVASNVFERFSSAAHRLERELEAAGNFGRRRGGYWGLTQQTARLTEANETLSRAIASGRSLSNCRGEFAEVADSWSQVRQSFSRTPSSEMPFGLTQLVSGMDSDFNRIERSIAGDFSWRYAQTSARRP